MKPQNKDLSKRVFKLAKKIHSKLNTLEFWDYKQGEATEEFTSIWNEDKTFQSLNKKAILCMIGLNCRWRFIKFNEFELFVSDILDELYEEKKIVL